MTCISSSCWRRDSRASSARTSAGGNGRAAGRTASAKWARTSASMRSVLASRPVALAKSRAWRGLIAAVGMPAIWRAASRGNSSPPVASTTTSDGARGLSRASRAAMPAGSLTWRSTWQTGLVAVSRWALEISMPTKIGVVLMGVRSGCDPGASRPCYAAWWPGDCSGWGRERIGMAARAFLGDRQELLSLRLGDPWRDENVVLRQGRRTLQSCLVLRHLLGRNANAVGIHAVQAFHGGMPALPGHPQCALQDHLQAVQQHAVPLLLQGRPAPFDRIVLAVVRRIVHQADLQPRPVRELDHPLQELRPPTRVLRAIVQVNHQAFDVPEAGADLPPPELQRIDPGIAGLP